MSMKARAQQALERARVRCTSESVSNSSTYIAYAARSTRSVWPFQVHLLMCMVSMLCFNEAKFQAGSNIHGCLV
jgi:hypothetical protein